jgi:hypothetical protein
MKRKKIIRVFTRGKTTVQEKERIGKRIGFRGKRRETRRVLNDTITNGKRRRSKDDERGRR